MIISVERLIPAMAIYESEVNCNTDIVKPLLSLCNFNIKNYNQRYNDKGGYYTAKVIKSNVWAYQNRTITPIQAIKTLDALEYNCNDCLSYYRSNAYFYLLKVREFWYKKLLTELKVTTYGGIYDSATWG